MFAMVTIKPILSLTLLSFLTIITLLHFSLKTTHKTPQNYHSLYLSSATNTSLSSYLFALTRIPHLAGTKYQKHANHFVFQTFLKLGLQTFRKHYNALLSYPINASLTLVFEDLLTKNLILTDSEDGRVVMPYHAYSPSGMVSGKALFVNYGREKDYAALAEAGISVIGCVAVARRGEMSRYEMVSKAAEKGIAAMVMYTETEGGFSNGVERGTVMRGLGDPLTPGWANVEGAERLVEEDDRINSKFPKIPSMPVSQVVADEILGTLGGARVPFQWMESMKAIGVKGVGPGPTVLNFTYQGEKRMATLHNIFAMIRGSEEPDRYVLLGNHRDAWTYGAVDPNSGTAALLDIARRFALLQRLGWRPRRTIIFCSWDGEEFGMVGSTEWVEQNLMNLRSKAVAYLNVDCAVQGPGLFVSATPQLDDLLVEVLMKVKDPESEDRTVYNRWTATNKGVDIQRLSRGDSDFSPLLHHAGVPSVDIYFGKDFPVYHTAFDTYKWMEKYGDPLFTRHVTVSSIWGLVALHLADDAILPFNYLSYATQLQEYANSLGDSIGGNITRHPLTTSIKELAVAAKEVQEEVKKLMEQESTGNPLVLRTLNDRLMSAERGFLDSEGLHGREWFKHMVYGPGQGDGDIKFDFFPGVVDAISKSRKLNNTNHASIQHEIWRVSRAIQRAAYALRGDIF